MNEQIRELAKEAGLWRQHYDIGEESPERLEKFAELIVKKCIFAVEDAGGIDKYHYTKAIREHFGVEE